MAGPIRIAILANGRQARAEIDRTAASADLIGKSFSRAGKLVAGLFAVDVLTRGAAAIVKTGGDYVESLNKIQAITASSQQAIDQAATALEAQSSLFGKMGETANDAAAGTLELTKAGVSLKDSLKAVYPTMVLAKSGQLEVADAATLVANTLNTFDLKASKASDVANELANAADISSANVADLAESFKYVSPLAAKSHVSLAQTNAVLAELANSGIKASQSGTGFRKFLASLQAPVGKAAKAIEQLGVDTFDAQGKMRPLGAIIDDLQQGLSKLTEKQQDKALRDIFGLTGITAAQVIIKEGTKGLDKYTKGVERADGAARLANASSKGLKGTLSSLRAETISEADALYRKYSPAVDQALKGLIDDAKKKLPDAISSAKSTAKELQPTFESLASLASDLGGDVKDLATGPLGKDLVGALKILVGLTKKAADLLDGIPDPIRQIGIEAGAAALLLPKFTNGITGMVGSATSRLAQLRADVSVTKSVTQQWALTTAALTSKDRIPDLSGAVTPQVAALQSQYKGLKFTQDQVVKSSVSSKLAFQKLGDAAKASAGVGGMLLLVNSSNQSNSAVKTLEGTLGAAAIGFSLGGPIGGAIGGLGGLIFQLGHNFEGTRGKAQKALDEIAKTDPYKRASDAADTLKSSLDQVTGAYTGATRAAVLKTLTDNGTIAAGAKYNLSARELVNAVLGQKDALSAITPVVSGYQGQLATLDQQIQAVKDSTGSYTGAAAGTRGPARHMTDDALAQIAALEQNKQALQTSLAEIQNFPGALQAMGADIRHNAAATADYTGKLKGIPASIRSKIEADGLVPTARSVALYAGQIKDVDKKQIRTLIKASGADATVKDVQRVIDKLTAAGKIKVAPDIADGVSKAGKGGENAASKAAQQIKLNLENGVNKTKANMPQLAPSVRQATEGAKGAANAGGSGIGSSVKQGFSTGFSGASGLWSASVAAAVNAAIAAGRAAAKAHSPSRETARLGADMADGLTVGMARKHKQTQDAGRDLIAAALAGVTGGSSGVEAALSALADRIDKTYDKALKKTSDSIDNHYDNLAKKLKAKLKGAAEDRALKANDKARNEAQHAAEKASKKAQKEINGLVKDMRPWLVANGVAQDEINASLETAESNLQSLVDTAQQYADSIRDAVVASGSLSTLGQGDGFSSIDQLISQRTASVAKAKEFADTINALTKAGLNSNDIQDLISQGVDGGLGTAEALLAAGPDAVAQMNTLSAQLVVTGTNLGANVSNTLYGAGISAAQGLVAGLQSQSAAIAAAAAALAAALTQAVKKKLKSHSPSLVFKGIGGDVVDGLALGLDDVYVRRQGEALATSLQRGFGSPALSAYLGTGGGATPVDVTGQIQLTAAQTDALTRGKAVMADIDVARAAGVRARA